LFRNTSFQEKKIKKKKKKKKFTLFLSIFLIVLNISMFLLWFFCEIFTNWFIIKYTSLKIDFSKKSFAGICKLVTVFESGK